MNLVILNEMKNLRFFDYAQNDSQTHKKTSELEALLIFNHN